MPTPTDLEFLEAVDQRHDPYRAIAWFARGFEYNPAERERRRSN